MLKRAIFASAAFVIAAMPMQAVITPASAAGPNVKPKIKVVPKLRVRVPRPKIRVRIDTKRLLNKKAPVKDPTKSGVAATIPKPKIDARDLPPGFAANAERLTELGEIGAFKDHIEDILGMLDIAGLVGALDIPELGNGQNNEGSGGKLGAGFAAAPSPGDAVGGIASQRTVTLPGASGMYDQPPTTRGRWRPDDSGGTYRVSYSFGSDATTVTIQTITASGKYYVTRSRWSNDGSSDSFNVTFKSPTAPATEKGSGDGGKPDSADTGKPDSADTGKPDSGDKVKPKDIAKLQDPDAGGGTVVWIPPSCGSATCNGIRAYLRDPKGALQQYISTKSTRVQGDRGADPNAGTSLLVIDQHGLVVSYGADSGPARTGGRVRRYDGPTRIVK